MTKKRKTKKVSNNPQELAEEGRSLASQTEAFCKQKIALENGFGTWRAKNHPELSRSRDTKAYVRHLRLHP